MLACTQSLLYCVPCAFRRWRLPASTPKVGIFVRPDRPVRETISMCSILHSTSNNNLYFFSVVVRSPCLCTYARYPPTHLFHFRIGPAVQHEPRKVTDAVRSHTNRPTGGNTPGQPVFRLYSEALVTRRGVLGAIHVSGNSRNNYI